MQEEKRSYPLNKEYNITRGEYSLSHLQNKVSLYQRENKTQHIMSVILEFKVKTDQYKNTSEGQDLVTWS